MVIKQSKLIMAYKATEKLADKPALDEQALWALYGIRRKLRPNAEYQSERENAIRQKYVPYANENGEISGQRYSEFLDELNAVGELDVDLGEITKIDIPFSKELGLTLHDIEALEDFVNFRFDFVCKTGE